jgi:AcrR family transcriptional regulator
MQSRSGTPPKRGATRTNMLHSAVDVLRERGAAGVTIDEVLARSGAPRGSVYYHFPDGRNQILTEALRMAGDSITALINEAATTGGIALIRTFVDFWDRSLVDDDFAAGCPVMAAAIGSGDDEPDLVGVAGTVFGHWRDAMARALMADGLEGADAESLAITSIAALEGAVVLCRSTRSTKPLHDVAEQIEFLIKAREFVNRFGVPSH